MLLRVGITSLLSWSSGIFSAVTFKPVATEVRRGQVVGSVEGTKHFDVVRSPVSGTISVTNSRLLMEPRLLNKEPYGEGWFAEIEIGNPAELTTLRSLPDAEPLIAESLRERHVHCFSEFPDHEMFEVGVECSAVLVSLNEFLAKNVEGTIVHIVSDDNTAEVEMRRWSYETGNAVLESRKEGSLYHFIVEKTG